MTTKIGSRLASERKRLGLTQVELAEIGGVATSAQSRYEVGKTVPDANYLSAFGKEGGDVLYVVTGGRSSMGPNSEQLLRVLINKVNDLADNHPTWKIQRDHMIMAMFGRLNAQVETNEDIYTLANREIDYISSVLKDTHGDETSPAAGQDISVSGDDNRVAGRDYTEKKGE